MFDLEENAELETLDNVPEDYRHFYDEADGKYTLSQDPARAASIKLVSGQHRALNAARAEATAHRKNAVDMSPLNEWGNSPADIAAAINAKIEEVQKSATRGKVDVDKLKESMEKANQAKLTPYEEKIGHLEGQLREMLVMKASTEAIAAVKGNAKLLMPHIERQVECVSEEGKFRVYVLDERGERRFSGRTGGDYMSIGELVEEMKKDKDFGRMFDSEAPRGGGSPPTGPGRAPMSGMKKSSIDKISAGLDAGLHEGRSGRRR